MRGEGAESRDDVIRAKLRSQKHALAYGKGLLEDAQGTSKLKTLVGLIVGRAFSF